MSGRSPVAPAGPLPSFKDTPRSRAVAKTFVTKVRSVTRPAHPHRRSGQERRGPWTSPSPRVLPADGPLGPAVSFPPSPSCVPSSLLPSASSVSLRRGRPTRDRRRRPRLRRRSSRCASGSVAAGVAGADFASATGSGSRSRVREERRGASGPAGAKRRSGGCRGGSGGRAGGRPTKTNRQKGLFHY